jgi:hypothetical protein
MILKRGLFHGRTGEKRMMASKYDGSNKNIYIYTYIFENSILKPLKRRGR